MAGGTTHGRESVLASAPKIKTKNKWIPAFAGMTNLEAFAEMKNIKEKNHVTT
jgi:hypothetical protein